MSLQETKATSFRNIATGVFVMGLMTAVFNEGLTYLLDKSTPAPEENAAVVAGFQSMRQHRQQECQRQPRLEAEFYGRKISYVNPACL